MLRVLLVDDDLVIRTNLKTLIEWEQYGFIIADEAVNGVECIQKMSTGQYDLVITDMNMPIMSGDVLLESIRQYYPDVEVIAISGYDDYHYVRDSLKNGAIDYILKHKLDKQTLCEVLETAKNKIIERSRLQYRSQLQSEQLSEGRTLMVQNMVKEILAGTLPYEEARRRMEIMEISCGFTNFILCYMEINDFPSSGQERDGRIEKSFINIVEKIITESFQCIVTYLENGRFVALIDFGKAISILFVHQEMTEIVSRIRTTTKKYLGLNMTIAVSSICAAYEKIPEYFNKLRTSLEGKFYEENEQVIWQYNEVPRLETQLSLTIKDEETIRQLLETQNREGTADFLDDIFDKCSRENVSVRSVQVICAELVNIAGQFCKKHSLSKMRDELGELQLTGEYVKKKFTELRNLVKQIYERIMQEFAGQVEGSGSNPYVIKAMLYISSNYRRNISLTDVAEYAGVSAQYMSRLLHEECQKGFAELLNSKRVEMACEMIQSHDCKIKEIVKRAGFNNYNYFFKVFKEITGLTPNQYEKQGADKG